MDPVNGPARIRYVFGQFSYLPHNGELHDGGKTLQLRPQVAKLLELLLRNANSTVSREEIRSHLWNDNIVVEFEEGISACVSQLRIALNEGASGTRYIHTVSRRGYKFIHPVSVLNEATGPVPGQQAAVTRPPQKPVPPAKRASWRWSTAALLAIVAAAAIATVILFNFQKMPAGLFAGHPAVRSRITIAVLPFSNLSTNRNNTVLGASIANEVIDLLGPVSPQRMAVIANTSSTHYADNNETVKIIGQALGASYVLEGSITQNQQALQISARLIRVADQSYIWGDEYALDADYKSSRYRQLVIKIATHVAALLVPDATVKPLEFTSNRDAALAFELGRYLVSQSKFDKAYAYCQRALTLDPQFAAAYVCAAQSLLARHDISRQEIEQARSLVGKSLGIDRYSATAHLVQGELDMFYDWNLAAAQAQINESLRLNPGDARAWQLYAAYLSASGQNKGMQNVMEIVGGLDPVSVRLTYNSALYFYIARQYDKAEEYARASVSLSDQNELALHILILSLLGEGKYAEASKQAVIEMRVMHAAQADIGSVQAENRRALVNYFQWYAKALSSGQPGKVTAVFLADAYMHLGESAKALETIRTTIDAHAVSILIPFISVWPSLHPLCKSGAFAAITRQLGQPGCLPPRQ